MVRTQPQTQPRRASIAVRFGFVIGQLGRGGSERQLYWLIRELRAMGDEPCVAVLSEVCEPYGPLLVELRVPMISLPRRTAWDLRRAWALSRWLRRIQPAAVWAFGEETAAYVWAANWFLGSRERRPWAAWVRRGDRSIGRWRRLWLRVALLRADALYANSKAGALYASSMLGVPRDRIRVCWNLVPEALFDLRSHPEQVRARVGVPEGRKLFVWVGRAAPEKDLRTLLLAARALEQQGVDFELLVVGPGLSCCPRGLSVPVTRVRWLGLRDDVWELLSAADLVLCSSRSEGCPNVVLEAMALGRPIVATAAGDIPALLDEGRGRVVPSGDWASLAREARRVVEEPALAEACGKRARDWARRLIAPEVARQLRKELYELGSRSQPPRTRP